MLSAQRIDIKLKTIRLEMTGILIEVLRDLASRAPDGVSHKGSYLVRHEPDLAPNEKDLLKSEPIPAALEAIQDRRKQDIEEMIQKIAASKSEIKRAKIADDTNAFTKATKLTSGSQAELRNLIEAPLSVGELSPFSFKSGQIGRLPTYAITVVQVINRKTGEALVDYTQLRAVPGFKIVGSDVTNFVDGGKAYLDKENCFYVAGTETYKTVNGGTNTIFRLEHCNTVLRFTDAEIKSYRDAAEPNFKTELTADEEATAQQSRLANAETKAKANLAKEQDDAEKERLMKTRRSKSNLDSAKLLIKKDQRPAARKYLEKAVAEDPDSESGKEAAKLLEDFP